MIIKKSDRKDQTNGTIRLKYAKCPHCGRKFHYIDQGSYRPATCSDWQCVRRSLHPNLIPR